MFFSLVLSLFPYLTNKLDTCLKEFVQGTGSFYYSSFIFILFDQIPLRTDIDTFPFLRLCDFLARGWRNGNPEPQVGGGVRPEVEKKKPTCAQIRLSAAV
jgi:hypothetical protein